jgi:hypothetical protein
MKDNPILHEIREARDEIARKTGYDIKRMFEFVRERERVARKHGVHFADLNTGCPPTPTLREDPPEYPSK